MSEPAKRTDLAHVKEQPATPGGSLISIIERVALNPQVNVENMERLLAMQERVMAREAEREFNEAMRAAQAEMPVVVRNAKNDQTNSRYATLDAVADAMDPVIHRHGFSLSFGTADSTLANHYRVTCKARHAAGHSEDYFADVPADMLGMKGNQNKTATHAFGSTMSYGRRYLKLLVFDVTLKDRDDDGNRAGGGVITEAQAKQIDTLITEAAADRAAFLTYLGVAELSELQARDFRKALTALQAKKRQVAAKDAPK